MMRIKLVAKTLLASFALLIFNGCSTIREPLNITLPELEYKEGICVNIKDDYEYGKCVALSIEALKRDRAVLNAIAKGCVR